MKRTRRDRSGQIYMRNEDLTVAAFLEQYREGFRDGYETAYARMEGVAVSASRIRSMGMQPSDIGERAEMAQRAKNMVPPKRKVKQSPKQKLLTKMTKVKWDKYKKGSGKKTYVEIRGEVSRSQKYKKACKRL